MNTKRLLRFAAIFAFVTTMLTTTVSCSDNNDYREPGDIDYSAVAVESLPATDEADVMYGNNRKEHMTTEFSESELNSQLLSRFWNMTATFGNECFIHDGTRYCHWQGTINPTDYWMSYIHFNQDWQDYAWPASVDAQFVKFYNANALLTATTQGRSVTIKPAEGKEYDPLFVKKILPISRNQSFEVVGYNDHGMVVDFAPTAGDLEIINEINRKKSTDNRIDAGSAKIRCFFTCMTREQYISAATAANN